MQDLVVFAAKVLRHARYQVFRPLDRLISYWLFYSNNVRFSSFTNRGWPKVSVARGAVCVIGEGFRSNNREMANPIGRFRPCSLIVGRGATLVIGERVGMSSTAIVCHERIEIGDNVLMGGNVVVYDTDFHSLDPADRLRPETDIVNARTAPVRIGKNVFVGAHSTILKGVTVGDNAIIGACSVVTRDIPPNEVWAGNPARKIRSLVTSLATDVI